MTEYRLRDYVPGEAAERERNRLIVSIATQVVPVFAIMAALAVAVLMLYLPPARYAVDVVVDPRRATGSCRDFVTVLDVARGAGVRVLVLAPDMSRPECRARYAMPTLPP